MKLRSGVHLQSHMGQMSTTFAQQIRASISPSSLVQWIVVAAVGLGLGLYTLAVSYLPVKWMAMLVLAAICPFVVMILGNVRKWLLVIIMLDTSLQVDANLFYRTNLATLGAIGGLNISITTLALAILYALWLGRLLSRLETQPGRLLRLSLPFAAYLVFVILSAGVAQDVTLSFFEISLLAQMFLLYLYVAGTVRTREELRFIVTLLSIGLLIQSLLIIGMYFTKQDFSLGGIISTRTNAVYTSGSGQWRPGGTLGSPNSAASYLGMLLPIVLSILFTRLGRGYKWLAALTFGAGTIALILTLSRGGWIAFAVSISLLCLFAWHRGWLAPTTPLAVAMILMLLFVPIQDIILTRLVGDDGGAALSRLPLIQLAFRMITDNPILGVGSNNFAIRLKEYAVLEMADPWLYTVHNKYLLIWAETGLGGLMTFLLFLGATLHRGRQAFKSADRFLSPLALGFTVAVVGQMSHMLVETYRVVPQSLWLITALLAAIYSMAGDRAEKAVELNARPALRMSPQGEG